MYNYILFINTLIYFNMYIVYIKNLHTKCYTLVRRVLITKEYN